MEYRVEEELVRKCQSEGSRYFEPLVRAYEAEAIRIATAMLGDLDAARDAAQDAFVKAFRSLSSFDPDRRFRPWFLQILRNQCRDALRSRKARHRLEAHEPRVEVHSTPDEADREHARHEAAALVRRGLAGLDETQREILVMKEIEELSYQEIAAELEIPEGTVASRLFHARRALKDALERMGVRYP